jgi:hypothetical protein
MLSVTSRVILFVSSYAPLLALFAILDSLGRGWPSEILAAFAGASVLALIVVWRLLGRSAGDWQQLASVRSRDSDVMAYFVSYVVPFAAAQDANTKTRIGLAVFAIILGALYIRSAIFYVHPLLLLAGFHIFDAATDLGVPLTLITRERYLSQTAKVWIVPVAPAVSIARMKS